MDLIVIGPTAHSKPLQTVLEENRSSVKVIVGAGNLVSHVPTRNGSGHVAVVGMSGRFPGSDSLEAFWESLLIGQDFHREVSPLPPVLHQNFLDSRLLDTQIKV